MFDKWVNQATDPPLQICLHHLQTVCYPRCSLINISNENLQKILKSYSDISNENLQKIL